MRTIRLDNGKYEFTIDEYGCLDSARRNGELWPAGFELRFTNCFMAALQRIVELEDAARKP